MFETVVGYQLPAALKGTILEKIVDAKKRELVAIMSSLPGSSLQQWLDRAPETRSFSAALRRRKPAIIAEIKRASPSAGLIREDFDPAAIAAEYQAAGAAALSVITEVHHFRGNLECLAKLRWSSKLPLLRKDFVIDAYQVIEARRAGADAILLIAALLDTALLKSLCAEAERFGMEALVEVHSASELGNALDAGASLIGVNSRDLRTFHVSLDTALQLIRIMPKDVLAVAESGIRTPEDVQRLRDAGYCGFLVGEQLMRSASPGDALKLLLRGVAKR
jgi:indole-3-glycerol phosphate synthase